ncbi:hypothetical protein JOQ06_020601 [Pogonophryne albipinna]|uniref:Uncharacterized protein n=1 Tax=Pogonophryne albipinna TaxID=1090488 RepID=A0AAD6FWG1_9TELE|nr:hypothetical protein JOQ06_020601 [Pogonophryne albipinna]
MCVCMGRGEKAAGGGGQCRGLIGVCVVAKRGARVYWRVDNEPRPALKGPFCGSLLAVYYPRSPGGC